MVGILVHQELRREADSCLGCGLDLGDIAVVDILVVEEDSHLHRRSIGCWTS